MLPKPNSNKLPLITSLLTAALLTYCAPEGVKACNLSTADTYRETAFQVLNIIDWGQTRYIAKNPDRYKEVESAHFISEHPTTGRVDAYMAQTAVLHLVATCLLEDEDWRAAFQYITIGNKLNATLGNLTIGVKMDFN